MKLRFPRACALICRTALIVLAFSVCGLVTAHADPPANDNLANAQVIPTDSFSVSGTDVGATQEAFEQSSNFAYTFGFNLNASVWYSWTPSASGVLQVTAPDGANGHKTPILLFKGPDTPTKSTFVAGGTPSTNAFSANVTADQPYFLPLPSKTSIPMPLPLRAR